MHGFGRSIAGKGITRRRLEFDIASMDSHNKTAKPCKPRRVSKRPLKPSCVQLRYVRCSLRTERACVHWVKAFIRWRGPRHPREMGGVEVERFPTHLAAERHVPTAAHRQVPSVLMVFKAWCSNLACVGKRELDRPVFQT